MADGKVTIDSELNDKGLEKGLSELQGKLGDTGKKLKDVGGNLTKHLTLPLTAAAGFAIKTGMDFEQGMAQVAAITGATTEEMAAMEAQARELGATTTFSAMDAAAGMEFLGRAGFDTSEIMAAMPGLLDLAAASGTDLGVAADIASNILSGFGLEAAEAGRVADVLALAAASANTDVAGMGEAMKYVAPVAATLGISVEDTAAAIGVLGDAGIQGGQAGTVLRRGLLNMSQEAGPAAELMKDLGIEVFDANEEMKSLPEVVGEVEKGLEGMSSQQKTAALQTLFGAEAVSGWSALVDAGSDKLGDFTGELGNAEGAAADMAATMNDTTLGMLKEMQSGLEEVALKIYSALQPALETVIGFVTELASWFNGLSDEMVLTITIVGAIVAAIGPLLVVLGTLIASAGVVIGALAGITPVGWAIIGAITAVIAIGTALAASWDTIRDKAIEVFSHFEPLLDAVRAAFQNLMDSVGPIVENLKNLWQSLIPLLQVVGTIIGSVLAVAFGILIGVINGAIAALGPLVNAFINVVDFAVNMVNAIVALFTGDFAGAFDFLRDAGQSSVDFFVNIFNGLVNFVMGFVDAVVGFFQGLYMTLVGNSIIPDMVNAIVSWFQNLFTWAIDLVRNIVTGIVNLFTNLFQQATSIFNSLRNTISSIWNGIKNTVSSIGNSIKNTISNIFNSLKGIVTSAFSNVTSAVRTGISDAYKAVTDRVKDFFNAGKNIVSSIADGISNAVGKVTDAIGNVTQKIRDFLPFSPAKAGPLMDIHRLNFDGPIGDSIEDAIPDVQAKMNAMLQVPEVQPLPRAAQASRTDGNMTALVESIEKLAGRPISVQVDGEEFIRLVGDDIDTDLSDRIEFDPYFRGDR